MLVPGCSGFDDGRFAEQYGAHSTRLLRAGFAVLRVDYLKARSVREACAARDAGTWEPQIADDIHQLARILPDDLNADQSRLYAIGWSMGGGGVLQALSLPASLRGAVALYPSCRAVRPWNNRIPTLLILAALDTIQPAASCESLVLTIGSPPSIAVRRFERAHHGFDIVRTPVVLEPRETAIVGANPDAATQAWADILRFLNGT
jgi:dienelactone hydrolase